MSRTELSILIATVSVRASLLSRLLACLEPQLDDRRVECIVHWNDRKFMGTKFNELYKAAYGRLAVQVDDDDLVDDDFVDEILAVSEGHDFVGYRANMTINGGDLAVYEINPARAKAHRTYAPWEKIRHVTPKCPLDTARARQMKFDNEYGADWRWTQSMIQGGYPFNPVFIPRSLYWYDCWPEHTLGTRPSERKLQREVPFQDYDPAKFTWIR